MHMIKDPNHTQPSIGYTPIPHGFPYLSVYLRGRPRHEKFDDFWRKHPPMSPARRAKIFAPFDALNGFDEAVRSKNVLYCEKRALSDGEKEKLDRKLSALYSLVYNSNTARMNSVKVSVEYFTPCTDIHNEAFGKRGSYVSTTGICRKIDPFEAHTITVDDHVIPLDDVADITGDAGVFDFSYDIL